MQSNLEIKKLQVELLRVSAAKAELELRIDEHMEDIKRLKEHIEKSELRENELKTELNKGK